MKKLTAGATVSIALLVLALAGCASSGPAIEDTQLSGLQQGRTTADDVVRRFGQPSFNSNNLDGTRTIAYLEPGSRSDSGAMVALIGAIASGAKPNVNSVIFRFDAGGRLSETIRTTESVPESTPARAGTITIPAQPAAANAPTATPAITTVPTATSVPATTAPATATTPAPARPAPKRQVREDGLPSWLPSGNYDPRQPF